ncbi:BZ3500_MvSof-1268-A1-R1_Chr4-2g07102 [Microbotryum saponariae]|uniref:BZ3500_MvSof-1268-A1-R1_Chr4-2g07102 protein n=1 Tax=Microbotryum saponariae TaxID=289078 RepID=A0A2X0LM31_9BASI|nr:BZ3500_MvSof-1268-A1-R1_Chr4-2g07102 [Microbotryum saponariae]SDA06767.1 BZ3501_MvSof-1269-A2-R1_Chr4-2g06813 [Microbotryum saponariae]
MALRLRRSSTAIVFFQPHLSSLAVLLCSNANFLSFSARFPSGPSPQPNKPTTVGLARPNLRANRDRVHRAGSDLLNACSCSISCADNTFLLAFGSWALA